MLNYKDPIYSKPPDMSDTKSWGPHLTDTKIRRYLYGAEIAYNELINLIDGGYAKLDDMVLFTNDYYEPVSTVLHNITAWYQFYESLLYDELEPAS